MATGGGGAFGGDGGGFGRGGFGGGGFGPPKTPKKTPKKTPRGRRPPTVRRLQNPISAMRKTMNNLASKPSISNFFRSTANLFRSTASKEVVVETNVAGPSGMTRATSIVGLDRNVLGRRPLRGKLSGPSRGNLALAPPFNSQANLVQVPSRAPLATFDTDSDLDENPSAVSAAEVVYASTVDGPSGSASETVVTSTVDGPSGSASETVVTSTVVETASASESDMDLDYDDSPPSIGPSRLSDDTLDYDESSDEDERAAAAERRRCANKRLQRRANKNVGSTVSASNVVASTVAGPSGSASETVVTSTVVETASVLESDMDLDYDDSPPSIGPSRSADDTLDYDESSDEDERAAAAERRRRTNKRLQRRANKNVGSTVSASSVVASTVAGPSGSATKTVVRSTVVETAGDDDSIDYDDTDPEDAVAGPSHAVAGPSHAVAGPSHAVAGPSHGVARPSQVIIRVYSDDSSTDYDETDLAPKKAKYAIVDPRVVLAETKGAYEYTAEQARALPAVYKKDLDESFGPFRGFDGGSFGDIYCVARRGETMCAKHLKDIDDDDKIVMASREWEIMKSINHQNVVKFNDAFRVVGQQMYILMELCKTNFKKYLNKHRLKPPDIHFALREILRGLNYLHMNRIAHRDVKPGNIFVTVAGTLKLGDFGCSRVVEPLGPGRRRHMSAPVGTKMYCAPEVLLGQHVYNFECDIWSVGQIGTQMYIHVVPFIQYGGGPRIQLVEAIQRMCGDMPAQHIPTDIVLSRGNKRILKKMYKIKIKDKKGLHFVDRVLQLAQADRPTARDLLDYPMFNELPPDAKLPLRDDYDDV